MDKPEQIAAGLTEAQREAIIKFPDATIPTLAVSVYPELKQDAYLPFDLAFPCLVGDGPDEKMECLTRLGLSVRRAILQAQENTNATGR